MSSAVSLKKRFRSIPSAKKIATILSVFLFCGITISAGYFYWQYKTLSSDQESARQLSEVTKAVGKLMVLPDDETPTLATVTDIDKIKSQPFFAHAQNGDKVLFYFKESKAILYRPSLKKIIDVTFLKSAQTAASASAQPSSAVLGTRDTSR